MRSCKETNDEYAAAAGPYHAEHHSDDWRHDKFSKSFCYKEANSVADLMAKYGRGNLNKYTALILDCNGQWHVGTYINSTPLLW